MKKILVIDDDEAMHAYLKSKIGARYEVVATSDAESALGIARRERPDLILCDIDMPEADGGDVVAALSADAALGAIPVLFLTSLATPQDMKAKKGLIGGRPAVAKGAPVAELVERIELLLRG